MATANIALEIFGIITTLMLLICCLLDRPVRGGQTGLFISMLGVNAAVLGCDLFTWVFHGRADLVVWLHIVNSLVYALGYVLTALFTIYLTAYAKCGRRTARRINLSIAAACLAAIGLVVVSCFNGMYFYYIDGEYIRGSLYWLSQAFPTAILVFDMAFILYNTKALGLRDTLSLLSYGVLPAVAMLIQIRVFGITLLYIATTLSLLIIYIVTYLEQSRRLQKREVELQQARIAIMLSQIQPHFLFNALSSIQCLCRDDPAAAERATADFSTFLRGNMDSLTMDKPIGFDRELEHTRRYLALELLRFPDKLRVEYDIGTTLFRLPTLTLQPIVENAVRYGVTKRLEGGTVRISSRKTDSAYLVTVRDDGAGFDPAQPRGDGHIGISNVRDRLARMSGGTLEIESAPGTGTLVTITIPKGAVK